MDKRTVEKFINDTCTAEEAEQVIEWLATEEGQKYLSDRLNKDAELLKNEKVKLMLPALDSKKMWSDIEGKVGPVPPNKTPVYYRNHLSSYRYVAAIVLFLFSLSFLFYDNYVPDQTAKEPKITYFSTNDQQWREITLSDGTEITLNNNSQLWVSATYGQPKREVTLKGEAYFEVIHNEDKPFIIHTKGVSIKDLGTAFNVRSIPGKKNVQVAVKSGKVSILQNKNPAIKKTKEMAKVELTPGQYAYVDLETSSISINEFEVENYFSWMNDRLQFNEATLAKASKQLSRIYNVTFSYAADSLKTLKFSAQFEAESLKRTLAVIALTLSIDYEIKNQHVIWKECKKAMSKNSKSIDAKDVKIQK